MYMKLFTRFCIFILFVLTVSFMARPAYAMTTRGGQSAYVPKDEVVTGTLVAGGNSVTIDGTVHGDVLCGSQSVVITGTVDGDVICGAQTIRVDGTVGGSVRAAAQTVEIAGAVKRNVTVMSQSLIIDKTASVGGEVLVAGQQFTDNGQIAQSLTGAVESAFLDAKVGGDVKLAATALTLGDNAKVAGSLSYESKQVAVMAPTATVAGTLTHTLPKPTETRKPFSGMKLAPAPTPVGLLWKIVGYAVLAIIVTAILPKRSQKILDYMRESPGAALMKGFLFLIIVPVVMISLTITIIGIPFAAIMLLAYILLLAVSRIFAAIVAGRYILTNVHANEDDRMLINIVVGVPVTWLVFAVPVLGGIAGFLAVIWGLGAIFATGKAK